MIPSAVYSELNAFYNAKKKAFNSKNILKVLISTNLWMQKVTKYVMMTN